MSDQSSTAGPGVPGAPKVRRRGGRRRLGRPGSSGRAGGGEGLFAALIALDRLPERRLRALGAVRDPEDAREDPAGAVALAALEDVLGVALRAADGTATPEARALQGAARDVLGAAAAFFDEAGRLAVAGPPSPVDEAAPRSRPRLAPA